MNIIWGKFSNIECEGMHLKLTGALVSQHIDCFGSLFSFTVIEATAQVTSISDTII